MESRPQPYRVIDLLPVGLALWLLWLLAQTWAGRLTYPYDLEWMEGGMLVHAWRLAEGKELYVRPGPEFVPYIYPPGYASVVAFIGTLTGGVSYTAGRAVSLFGTLAAAASVVFVVLRQRNDAVAGLVAAIIFLGCYEDAGAFYDLVRPDGLLIALLGWSVAIAAERRRGALEVGGLLLCAAFLMKHNAATFGFPMALGIWARDGWRSALRFGLWAAVPAAAMTAFLQWDSNGHFLTYLLKVPRAHPFYGDRAFPGAVWEVGLALPVCCAVLAAWTVVRGQAEARNLPEGAMVAVPLLAGALGGFIGVWAFEDIPGLMRVTAPYKAIVIGSLSAGTFSAVMLLASLYRDLPWGWVYGFGCFATAIFVTCMMRGHFGGFLNVLIPAFYAVSLGFGFAVADLRRRHPGVVTAVVGALLLTLQVGHLLSRSNLTRLVPNSADQAAGDKIVAKLAELPGPIAVPIAPWLAHQAGHEPGFHLIAIWDLNHKGGAYRNDLRHIRRAAQRHHWSHVVEGNRALGYGISKNYRTSERIAPPQGVFRPRTGWRSRPTKLLVPKR